MRTGEGPHGVLADWLPDALAVIQDGRCVSFNAAFAELLGYERDELNDNPPVDNLLRPRGISTVQQWLEAAGRNTELNRIERVDAVKKGGDLVACDITVKPVEFEDRPAHVLLIRDVRERERAERDLKVTEEQYRLLIESQELSVLFYDTEGTLLFINDTAAMNMGGKASDFTGRHITDLFRDDADLFMKRQKIVAESGESMVSEDLIGFPGGSRWFLSTLQPVIDDNQKLVGIQIVSIDITERKLAEEKYRQTNAQLQATLNALPDLMFEVDCDGLIYDFRAPHPELLYRKPEEFVGQTFADVIPEPAASLIMGAVEEAAATGQSKGTEYSLEMAGEQYWFELSLAVKGDLRSRDCHLVALVRDITDRKHSEEKLKLLADDLMAERRELTEKNVALKQILDHIESQKKDMKQEIYQDIENGIFPILSSLRKQIDSKHYDQLERFESEVRTLLSLDRDEFRKQYGKLTSRESEICDLIKTGMSSKQIADQLNLSILTVLKHRENIRRKLGISGTQLSLATYLRSK